MKYTLLLSLSIFAQFAYADKEPQNFLFIGGDSDTLQRYETQIKAKNIDGVQIVYSWKMLEPSKDHYDFSMIKSNLNYLNSQHKRLFIQIQDRFFTPQAKNVPLYLQTEPIYNGGIAPQLDNPGMNKPLVSGWVAMQWNPAVQARYQKLIRELARRFDGKIYGINLPETAIDIEDSSNKSGFSCEKYFNAEVANILTARQAFKHSRVVQYVNFFPCEWNNDHNYMNRMFNLAKQNNIGLGGPDVIPYKKSHMENSYQFFTKNKQQLELTTMAVQAPDYTYINPQTQKKFTHTEFNNFARDYLGADIIFWDVQEN